jgi:hypothetical protein
MRITDEHSGADHHKEEFLVPRVDLATLTIVVKFYSLPSGVVAKPLHCWDASPL